MRQFHLTFGRAVFTLAMIAMPLAGQSAAGKNGVALRAASQSPRPGDRIYIHFLRERDLSDTVRVNERSEAVFPKLGLLPLSGLTIGELDDTLRVRYAAFLKEPEMEVLVLRRVSVNGEVKNPAVYYVEVAANVRDAIAIAGGVVDAGKRSAVSIVRGAERIPVRDWEHNVDSGADLESGDQVLVGRRSWLSLNFLPVVSAAALLLGVAVSVVK